MGLNGSSGEVTPLRRAAQSVTGALDDYESLLSLVADRRLVLIGEASHTALTSSTANAPDSPDASSTISAMRVNRWTVQAQPARGEARWGGR